ncbi:acyl-CoA thioester hydrolase YciA [Buchnera aphidicola (Chaitoregma tattakana)]|uniref:acyl-CoA thioester hydrolase YciA n=1 Tax=Buchnera aphidicola TaxID=9 RepID=UPI0031B8A1AD
MCVNKKLSKGKLVIRTLAMPKNINANGSIFGGWIMSQIDLGGAILAKEISKGNVMTVRVKHITFLQPIFVGEIVSLYAKLYKIGVSSMHIKIQVWTKKVSTKPIGLITYASKANLIYVAIDRNKKKRLAFQNYFIKKK